MLGATVQGVASVLDTTSASLSGKKTEPAIQKPLWLQDDEEDADDEDGAESADKPDKHSKGQCLETASVLSSMLFKYARASCCLLVPTILCMVLLR